MWRGIANGFKFLLGLSLSVGGILLGVYLAARINLTLNHIFLAFVLLLFLGLGVNWVLTHSH